MCARVSRRPSDGSLTETELSQFLGSFLSALVSMSDSVAESQISKVGWLRRLRVPASLVDIRQSRGLACVGVAQIHTLLQSTCDDVTDSILGDQDRVSFQFFGNWYNDGGHDKIPWLELLDVSKWSRM